MKFPLSLCGLLLAAPLALHAKPPTVDPTYGLPLPAHQSAPATMADWIWAAQTQDNQDIFLRRTFTLTSMPKTATLDITADDFFTLSVNGKRIDQSVPGAPGVNVWQTVHRLNIAPELMTGQNVLMVQARNVAGAAGVVAQLTLPGQKPIVTDSRWQVRDGVLANDATWRAATVEAPIDGGVWAENGGLQGWPGYNQMTAPYLAHILLPVASVQDVQPGAGKIVGADHLPGHRDAVLTVTPAPVGATDPPNFVIDFGKEVAGRIQITPLTAGVVQVGTGESHLEATQSPWGGLHSLTLTPGTRAYTPYSAFRYVYLVFPAAASPTPIRLRVCLDDKYYPVRYQGSFSCSDPLLTQIWYTGAYTAHLCMQEDIWDAPKRDRARWMGDLNVSGEVINDVFADKFLMEQTMQRLRDAAPGGRPDDQLPVSHVNSIPGYSCAWICTLADFQRHLGDQAYLMKQHALLLSLLSFLQGETNAQNVFVNTRGEWPFVDWSPGFDKQTPLTLAATDFFLIRAAHDAVFLLTQMGDTANSAKYATWADALTNAAQQSLLDTQTQTFGTRLQENAMAVYSGAATPAEETAIYQTVLNLNSDAWDKTGIPPYNDGVISPYYGNYILRALSRCGQTEAGLSLLRSYWGGMLAEGATTFWEAYDPHWPKHHYHAHLYADDNHGTFVSLCHGWSSGPTSWLTDDVLGVHSTGSGFQTVRIQPELGDLRWAEGNVPTPHGLIHVRADRTAHGLRCRIILPPGVKAQVILPGKTVSYAHAGSNEVESR